MALSRTTGWGLLAAWLFTSAGLAWMAGISMFVLGAEDGPVHAFGVIASWVAAGAIVAAFAVLLVDEDGTYGIPRRALFLFLTGVVLLPVFLFGLPLIFGALIWIAVAYPAGSVGPWAEEKDVRSVAVAFRWVPAALVPLLYSAGGPDWASVAAALPFGLAFFVLGRRLLRLVRTRPLVS